MARNFFIDQTPDLVAAWDHGELVPSIAMGGLGPGYEQAIQILAMEMLRAGDSARFEAVADEWSERLGGLTGAMVAAAKNLAANVLRKGMQRCRREVPEDRHILVSRNFPVRPS